MEAVIIGSVRSGQVVSISGTSLDDVARTKSVWSPPPTGRCPSGNAGCVVQLELPVAEVRSQSHPHPPRRGGRAGRIGGGAVGQGRQAVEDVVVT